MSDIIDVAGEAADFDRCDLNDLCGWLLVQAGWYFVRNDVHYHVSPRRLIAFSAWPGDGAGGTNFGLADCDMKRYLDGIFLDTPRQ